MSTPSPSPQNNGRELSLSNPCPESFEGMAPTKAGGWCGKCNHEVVDFRGKSNEEILAMLQGSNKPCGVFNAHQLGGVEAPRLSIWQRTRRVAAVSVALLGFQVAVNAQTASDPQPEKYPEKVCPVEDSPGHEEVKSQIHWWQFRKKRLRKRRPMVGRYLMGCPSF